MASGEMTEPQYTGFVTVSLRNILAQTVSGALAYMFIDWRHVWEAQNAARAVGCELLNLAVWVKHNPGLGSFYRSGHELVLVLKHGKAPHRNNVELGRFGRNRSNVWTYRGANDFGRGEGEGDLLALHPTPKPIALVEDAILDCTARGEIVIDGFLGIGSTVIAAQRCGRRCFGIELEGRYVDAAVRRWQRFTGNSARLAATGRSFDDIEAEARAKDGG
jgi:DNA modification methylase